MITPIDDKAPKTITVTRFEKILPKPAAIIPIVIKEYVYVTLVLSITQGKWLYVSLVNL